MTLMPHSTPTRDFSFDDWIETGTVAQRQLELHNDRAIPGKLDALDRRRRIAQTVAEHGGAESSVADVPELAQIDAEIDALVQAWDASKETWTVRALAAEEIDALRRDHPAPALPPDLPKNASKHRRAIHEARMQEWADETAVVREAADLAYLTATILSVATAKGTTEQAGTYGSDGFTPAVSADQLRRLFARPGRQGDLQALMAAALEAQQSEVALPAPFSQRTSETDPT